MTTAIIRPNGVGTYTEVFRTYGAGAHWQLVDEAVADDLDFVMSNGNGLKPGDADENGTVNAADSTYIQQVILGLQPETVECDVLQDGVVDSGDVTACDAIAAGTYDFSTSAKRDSYALEDPGLLTGSIINSVKVYFRGQTGPSTGATIAPGLILASNDGYAAAQSPATSFTLYNATVTRPGGGTWSVADFVNLEVLTKFTRATSSNVQCSQVYVEIDYTLPVGGQVYFMI